MATPTRKRKLSEIDTGISSASPSKRKSYTTEFKLKVIAYAEENGNRSAGRYFEIDEKCVRPWKQEKDKLECLPKRQRARRGGNPKFPKLEEDLKLWIENQREKGRAVSTLLIRLRAQTMGKEMGLEDFIGGPSWCYRFMKRNNLSVRNRTTVGQKLPDDWEKKVTEFRSFVNEMTEKYSLKISDIGNMDEVPMSFDAPPSRTVDGVGKKTVNIVTTGSEKTNFTVVLSCMGDGSKLKPMVIFKRVTVPKDKFPAGIIVRCNPKGWMNEDEMKIWIDQSWRRRPGNFFNNRQSMLVIDSMSSHKQEDIKSALKKLNTVPCIIPGGLTKVLQPLDLTVNRVFKIKVREEWEKWMTEGMHTYTKTGKMRRASYVTVCEWVLSAWKAVSVKTIQKAFHKAGIVNEQTCSESDSDDDVPLSHFTRTIANGSDGSDDDVPLSRLVEKASSSLLDEEQLHLFYSDSEDENFNGFDERE